MNGQFDAEDYAGLPAADPRAPKYWRHETGGLLKAAVEAYLNGNVMTLEQINLMRCYLRQWIMSPRCGKAMAWRELRKDVEAIRTRRDIGEWLRRALDEAIDPL
jgi:hypothetical protein